MKTVHIPKELHAQLKTYCAENGLFIEEKLEQIITEFLERKNNGISKNKKMG